MAFEVGTATDHNDLIDKIRIFLSTTLPLAERHIVLRNINEATTLGDGGSEKTVIFQAPGLAASDQIFFGLKIYKSVSSDYYNCQIDGFTGYVAGNTFESQPGSIFGAGQTGLGITLWNQVIPYWLIGNGQGFICVAKIQNTYVTFGAGFLLKYATFTQYPYPLVVFSNLTSAAATRYSITTWVNGWKGARQNLVLRFTDGVWKQPQVIAYQNLQNIRNTNNNSNNAPGYYGLHPLELSDTTGTGNIYGMLDGLFFISGFNNAVENTLTVSGTTYVVFRDGTLTGVKDYCALKLA